MLNQDFREFIQSLNEHKVRYLVIGGYVVAFHGHPRDTKNLDVWIVVDENNAERLLKALTGFGLGSLGLSLTDLTAVGQVVQPGYPPNRIDLVTAPDGVDFDDCYALRVTAGLDGVEISLIDLENLIRNKRASGRHQDLADVDQLS